MILQYMPCSRLSKRALSALLVFESMLYFEEVQAWVSTAHSIRRLRLLSTYTGSYSASGTSVRAIVNTESSGAEEVETPYYPQPRPIDPNMLGDLTGGRPGAIVETEEQLELKGQILQEMENGSRQYDLRDYGTLIEDEEAEYDIDDPDALDQATLGTWTIQDLNAKFDYEWDPSAGEPDPNQVEMQNKDRRTVTQNERDEDGVEIGYNPVFGPSNPVDVRTIRGTMDSVMVDERTRDESRLTPQFADDDQVEAPFNEDVAQFRKSLDVIETYVDEFLPESIPVPRHVAKWHGYPEQTFLAPKNYTNNRFTDNPTNFDELTPFRARQLAVEMARAKNAEWLPDGVSQAWHATERAPYEAYDTLLGTLRAGDCDASMVAEMQPALQIFGSCVDLLSIDTRDADNLIVRFAYHGLMKNRFGMQCWMESLLREECNLSVSSVIFETGFRKRDAPYDGGDPWYGPSN